MGASVAVITSEYDIERILGATRTVAVLGASPRDGRPANYVPEYLSQHGYTMIPVNPAYPDALLWGRNPVARLTDVAEPVEMVLVFRRPQDLPAHVDEILAMTPLPAYVWLQSGIRHDDVADRLSQEGIDVIQDRCMMVMHKRRNLDDAVSL
jgi:uncharacterized protein